MIKQTIKKTKEILDKVVEAKYIKQVKIINQKGYVSRIFSHWSDGENFVADAEAYAKSNNSTCIKE